MGAAIRADLVGSVHLDNGQGQRVVLTAGQPVPAGYTAGGHVLEPGPSVDAGGSGSGADLSAEQQELVAGSIGDVLGRVGDDLDKAVAVLAAEQKSEAPRKGVVEPLQKLVDAGGSGS